MQSITPCQRSISDRFPVVSFAVRVPPARCFEIACATDPALLRADGRRLRTDRNFYTSRSSGLLRAAAGQATVLLPPDQLRRFAGCKRLYYVLGSYGPRGDDPHFSAPPDRPETIPAIAIAADFTGRTLDRGRIAGASGHRYGSAAPVLAWGGDAIAAAVEDSLGSSGAIEYDDGYGSELWTARTGTRAVGADYPDPPDPIDAAEANANAGAYGARATRDEPGAHERYGSAAAPAAAFADVAGYEDAPGLRRADGSALRPTAARMAPLAAYGARPGEPAGVEDAPHLARLAAGAPPAFGARPPALAGHAARAPRAARLSAPMAPRRVPPSAGARFGRGQQHTRARIMEATSATPPAPDMTVDDAYEDGDAQAGPLAVPPEFAASGEALTIRRKLELLVPISELVAGAERYSALAGDIEYEDATHPAYQRTHHGLHWGLLALTQRSGLLGRTLLAAQRRDAAAFAELFGPASDALLQVTTAPQPEDRVRPVDGAFLWQSPWSERFRAAGAQPFVQAAQNEIVIEQLVDPVLPMAALLGLTTDRALALLVDRCVHMGSAGGRRFVVEALSPLGEDNELWTRALAAVGAADLTALQTRFGLPADGRASVETHAALLGALRTLGARAPFPIADLPARLDSLVHAARGRRFAQRSEWLRGTQAFGDLALQIG